MKNKIKLAVNSAFLAALTLQTIPTYAEEGTLTLTAGVDYSTGKYGLAESTDMTYMPFIAKYEMDDTTLKLSVPWLKITGPGDVVGGNTPIVIGSSNRPITTQSGLGDIVLTVSHTILRREESSPLTLDITGKVKFATASASKGLGTGENDYSVALDAYKPLNNTITLFGDVGYKVMGDPTGVNLNNVWFGSAGLSYRINTVSSAGIMADTRQATQNTSDPMRELTVFLTHKFNARYKLQSYLTHGYTNTSTDWGGGLMLGWVF